MPHRILRSIIEFDTDVTQENLIRNFQLVRHAIDLGQFTFTDPTDGKIYLKVLSHFSQYFEVPSSRTVKDYFTSIEDGVAEITRLKMVSEVPEAYTRSNFFEMFKALQTDQALLNMRILMRDTLEMATKGKTIDKTEYKGLEEAIHYMTRGAQSLRISDIRAQISGDIRDDGQLMREEYERAEQDQGSALGVLSGIREMDESCKGAKKGELWIHAGFPGELKSTLAANWCYNAVTMFRKNVVYFSFEMPREQIRRNIFAIHSAHAKFKHMGFEPLDYIDIRDGNLTPEQKDFYFNYVIPDLEENEDYTHFEVITPDRNWTMDDVTGQLEMLHKEFEVGFVVLDHGQWIDPREKHKDYTIALNSVIRDSKRLALNFDHNEGVPILMLFQINRNGKTEADKNDGVYKMNALTYANEAEKTADVITTTYLNDDLRSARMTKISNLKNRDNPKFAPFSAQIEFSCRKMHTGPAPELVTSADEHDLFLGDMDMEDV